ncbi:C-type mannose receptor 2-like [Cololabis saira]|uniref:C-type mannose receptor 2-like n=1 Tax=Cololabis saira TaxID=129043 RepID=UPI002AD41FF9|nr:C-type mannose receptor 2-like [Cololabis saira]
MCSVLRSQQTHKLEATAGPSFLFRMSVVLLLVLTSSGLSVSSMSMFREYHHMKTPKTWAEAQRYCREAYADLATVETQHENNNLQRAIQKNGRFAWIGLHDDVFRWKWTMGDEDFNYDHKNWKDDGPKNLNSSESCVVMTNKGVWRDEICEKERPSVCFYEPGPSKYILVETMMTWQKAKEYCRSRYTDLVRVRNARENEEINQMLRRNAWIGLHRDLWSPWSDQSPTNFTNWNEGQPDNSGPNMTSCAAVNTSTGKWWDVDCEEEHEFICQTLIPPRTRFVLRFQSEADLTDPDIQQQILEQLQAKLEEAHELTELKLRWIQADEQTFHKKQKKKQGSASRAGD